jgi:NAD(P)H-dependent FMN reductase
MMRLHVIIASTRPNRIGPAIGHWFHGFASEHGGFDSHLVDLADFDLPVFDEPRHPALGDYAHAHTKRWSESVKAADAFAFVTPEYNFGPPPSLLNALNFVYREWNYATAGIVSYGGVSGGTRAGQALRPTLSVLKMPAMAEGVAIPMAAAQISDGKFIANELNDLAAKAMLDEMARWTGALAGLRAERK